MSDAPTEHALARAMNAALLPQAFPFRREVEFAGARHGSIDRISFYDAWWADGEAVCFAAASLPRGGMAGTLAAASLKHMMRVAMAEFADPRIALASCRRFIGTDTGVAVALIDLRSGWAMISALGSGTFGDDAGRTDEGRFALRPGADLWIGAGPDAPETMAGIGAGLSAAEIVAAAGHGLRPGAAIGLIRFKGPVRRAADSTSETISLGNENGQVAQAIARIEDFRERHGIDEHAFAGLDLAVDELLTNVVSYAFRDGASHRIDVELGFSDERLSIEIRDDGIPFNPLDIPPPKLDGELAEREVGGLGMHFVRNIADEITYRREANWNILSLSKNMPARGAGQGGGGA
jgi:anti-sigma regulatory factor (Ser/Thr protein kinase)